MALSYYYICTMSFREKLSRTTPEQLYLQQLPEMAHHMAFDWGALQISEGASEAYDLAPLTPDVKDGPLDRELPHDEATGIGVNVIVLGPDEGMPLPGTVQTEIPIAGTLGFAGKDTVYIVNNFGLEKQKAADMQLDLLKTMLAEDIAESTYDDELPLGPGGIPLPEVFLNEMPQIYAHMLADVVQASAAGSVNELLYRKEADQFRKSHARLGRAGILGAGGMVFIESAVQGRVSLTGYVIGGLYLAWSHRKAGQALKGFLRAQPEYQLHNEARARELSARVSTSIHRVYCRRHFENTIQNRLIDPENS
jgi:hypothetical protein